MKANWFEVKIKCTRVGEDGRERKVTELYLLDAVSYSEAEKRIITVMEETTREAFNIVSLKPSRITEVVESKNKDHDKWFRGTVDIIDVDGISGRERKQKTRFLVAGSDMDSALANLQKVVEPYVVPNEIVSIQDTTFVDVIPYFNEENSEDNEVRTE